MSSPASHWTAGPEAVRQRLDLFLQQKCASFSRSRIQKLIENGHVTVNGGQVKAGYRLHPNDRILLVLPAPEPMDLEPQEIPLDIAYEDAHLLVVNKSAGMVVHPGAGNPVGTLVHALLHHCRDLQDIGGKERPGLVHRLDKETSGLMVVAKTSQAYTSLVAQFQAHSIVRRYLALVLGIPSLGQGRIELAIGRDYRQRKKISSRTRRPRPAITRYRVLERYLHPDSALSLLSVRPETGRTHQIRVHLSNLGHPVLGDKVYGGKRKKNLEKILQIHRQMLHAQQLGFHHPGLRKDLLFSAPLPTDMVGVLEQLAAFRP